MRLVRERRYGSSKSGSVSVILSATGGIGDWRRCDVGYGSFVRGVYARLREGSFEVGVYDI